MSWLSEGAELRETKDESGKLTRQEFHQKAASLTNFCVASMASPELGGSSSGRLMQEECRPFVDVGNRKDSEDGGIMMNRVGNESHTIAQSAPAESSILQVGNCGFGRSSVR